MKLICNFVNWSLGLSCLLRKCECLGKKHSLGFLETIGKINKHQIYYKNNPDGVTVQDHLVSSRQCPGDLVHTRTQHPPPNKKKSGSKEGCMLPDYPALLMQDFPIYPENSAPEPGPWHNPWPPYLTTAGPQQKKKPYWKVWLFCCCAATPSTLSPGPSVRPSNAFVSFRTRPRLNLGRARDEACELCRVDTSPVSSMSSVQHRSAGSYAVSRNRYRWVDCLFIASYSVHRFCSILYVCIVVVYTEENLRQSCETFQQCTR